MDNRRNDQAFINRLDALEQGHEQLKKSIDINTAMTHENTLMTEQIQNNTSELIELFLAAKGGLKVAIWLARVIKIIGGAAAAGFGGYIAIKSYFGIS